MTVNSLIYAQVNLLLNTRLKDKTCIGDNFYLDLDESDFCYEVHHKKYGDIIQDLYHYMTLPNSIKPFSDLQEKFNLPSEVTENVSDFFDGLSMIFSFQTETQYYQNNVQRIFFFCQTISSNDKFKEYNVKNFFKYSYTSGDFWKFIKFKDNNINIVFDNIYYELYPLVKYFLETNLKNEIVKILLPICKSILVKEANTSDQNLLSDIVNDDLAQYILVDHNELKLDTKKYLKILLKCLDEKQGAVNILVSKFILNSFLHYVLPYDLSFLKNHEEKLIKYSGNKKILKKMYKVLYNLNQVKGNFWDSIDFKCPNKNYIKYEIIYSLEMKKQ